MTHAAAAAAARADGSGEELAEDPERATTTLVALAVTPPPLWRLLQILLLLLLLLLLLFHLLLFHLLPLGLAPALPRKPLRAGRVATVGTIKHRCLDLPMLLRETAAGAHPSRDATTAPSSSVWRRKLLLVLDLVGSAVRGEARASAVLCAVDAGARRRRCCCCCCCCCCVSLED